MKSETYENKVKELKKKLANVKVCPRNEKKIAEMKSEIKRLSTKAKEKRTEEKNKTVNNVVKSSKKKSSVVSEESWVKIIKEGMSKFNPWARKEFEAMNKKQLKEELKYRVQEMIDMNITCVKEGLKTFSSKQQLINESIAEVCQEQNITIEQYYKLMRSN